MCYVNIDLIMNRATCYRQSLTRCWANFWIPPHIISQFLMEEIIFLHNSKLSPVGLQSPPTTLLWVYPQEGAGSKYQNGRWTIFSSPESPEESFLCLIFILKSPFKDLGIFSLCSIVKLLSRISFGILCNLYIVLSDILDSIQKFNWMVKTFKGERFLWIITSLSDK